MRLFYISSGSGFAFSPTLTDEDYNIIRAFRHLEKKRKGFQLETFLLKRDKWSQLLPRIKAFRPDAVLVFKGFRFPSHYVAAIRKIGYRVGVWFVDDPYRLQTHYELAKPYSFVITQEASCVKFYRQMGKVSFHLPLAVNVNKYTPYPHVPVQYESDVCFVGSGFPARIAVFDQLAPFLSQRHFFIIGQWWHRLKSYPILKHGIMNKPIPPSEVIKYYNGAKIVLNVHRTPNDRHENFKNLPALTPNNRTFEIAACRAFQLTSYRGYLSRYYKRDELVSFSGWRDLQRKINYYLDHPYERKEVARRAYERTLSHHTYETRLTTLIETLNAYILRENGKPVKQVDINDA